ncbi:MAG: hypothetical protein WCZ89_09330 [Phycisphaerae bacterium]
MYNRKKIFLFLMLSLICFMLIQSLATKEKQNKNNFNLVQADKYFVPSTDETVAILFYPVPDISVDFNDCPDFNCCPLLALIGDIEMSEEIIGKSLEPMKLVEDPVWLKRIMTEYNSALKEAEEKELDEYYGIMGKVVFVTKNKAYIRNGIEFNDRVAYDNYMESAILRDYFKELGFIPIKLEQAEKSFIPLKGEIIAILIYSGYCSKNFLMTPPLALLGNKNLTEKLLYGDKKFIEKLSGQNLDPKKIFEDANWIEKIRDAYKTAIQEAEGQKSIHEINYEGIGDIIFLTLNKGYIKPILINTNAVLDGYMESEQLKKYFDELGLTEELLALPKEPNQEQ